MKKIALAILCVILVSCKKNDEIPTPKTLLTFTGDPAGIITSSTDDWIFVTDESGNVLDSKPFEAGTAVTLTTTQTLPTQKINVTLFRYLDNEVSYFTTYLAIPVGQTWNYYTQNADLASQNPGIVNVAVTDLGPAFPPDIIFTDADGSIPDYNGSSTSPPNFFFQVSLKRTPARIYAAGLRNNIAVVAVLDNATPGSSFTASYATDFKVLDNSISIPIAGSNTVSATVAGLNGNGKFTVYGGNLMFRNINRSINGSLTIGYNNGFAAYKTDITLAGNPTKSYSKVGTVPTSAPMLNYTLSVTKNDYKDFAFTISGTFNVRQSVWTSKSGIQTWNIYSPPDGKQKVPTIPQAIRDKYPALKPDDYTYKSSGFTVYLDGSTYDDFLKQGITGPWTKYPAESQSILFSN